MDLCADMLLQELTTTSTLTVKRVCPSYRRRLSRLPWLGRNRSVRNVDRLLNRFFMDYPRYLRGLSNDYDLFHICDHSYAQLVHVLPPGRVGVYCYDLDTFRCLLEPQNEPRSSSWFRRMARQCAHRFPKSGPCLLQARSPSGNSWSLFDWSILPGSFTPPSASVTSSLPPKDQKTSYCHSRCASTPSFCTWAVALPESASTCCSTSLPRSERQSPL